MDNYDKLNREVVKKTKNAVEELQTMQDRLGMKHSNDSLKIINTRISKKIGFVNRITFKFKKSGVFVHKGVGRGTNIGQVGTTNRVAKEWFNPVIEKYADEITEIIADEWVEISFNKLKLK